MGRIIIFRIGDELFGGGLEQVREVLEKNLPLTWVPRAPSWVKGAAAHHGRAVLLVDLSEFLHLPAQETEAVILLDSSEKDIGLCVGEIVGIEDTAGEDVQGPDQPLAGAPAKDARPGAPCGEASARPGAPCGEASARGWAVMKGEGDGGRYVDRFILWKERIIGILNFDRCMADLDGYF